MSVITNSNGESSSSREKNDEKRLQNDVRQLERDDLSADAVLCYLSIDESNYVEVSHNSSNSHDSRDSQNQDTKSADSISSDFSDRRSGLQRRLKNVSKMPRAFTASQAMKAHDIKNCPYPWSENAKDIRKLSPATSPPRNQNEARKSEYWPRYRAAKVVKVETLNSLGTDGLVHRRDVPRGTKIIKSRWMYDHKRDEIEWQRHPQTNLGVFKVECVHIGKVNSTAILQGYFTTRPTPLE
jgi:hypothetical protein